MKKIFFVFVAVFGIMLNAQEASKHIPISKDLVGFWQQRYIIQTANGEKKLKSSGNYKVINPDGTYYTFMIVAPRNSDIQVPIILQYGTYELIDDTHFNEHIIDHNNPKFVNTNSQLRYKKMDDNMILQEYKNEKGVWIPEIWRRADFKIDPIKTENKSSTSF
ncbi:DUF4488 domain-containing protein [Ornithobacterium rhinotracheale]|nr:DUF4488 domain-containing protein [Ornithobacterium rhinotracheale]AIQ00471.1 hypothetical protein Q785_05310 [Ornithobacterium rhinotracheale ORT-UMN 88]KGB67440.1 hypothetical protein Q787_05185 [Ornithobacterium rhinotracheale H06-030791]MCK0194341.1 DUF4488 domain-containing protein [Ornithobacterium rhinotracheale]MCK0199872.1 DUF4488 domain-containing protein [Ornithobacterium rhinotracheale]UOH64445.1 DUF4488 domain-containing protein [Ornithobacterium rhinotracheale]